MNSGSLTLFADTEITVTDSNGASASFPVVVKPLASSVSLFAGSSFVTVEGERVNTRIPLNGRSLKVSLSQLSSLKLSSVVYPNGSSPASQTVSWKTSSAKVAVVDGTGSVALLKPGTVTLTVTAADGSGCKQTLKLVVVA